MRVGIVGLGLIGGSLALALRGRYEVTGWSPSPGTRAAAGAAGVAIAADLGALLPADAVIVCAPLAEIVPTLERLAARSGNAVLIDVGSLKGPVAAYALRAPARARIVGGHPMAGTTATGFAAAEAGLFRDRPFLLVPTARSDEASLTLAGELARAAGGIVTVLGAEAHDRVVAVLSALPFLVAAALARAGAELAGSATASLAGPGFRDTTRLAGTPPSLAASMLAGNSPNVLEALARFRASLDALERAVATGDPATIAGALAELREVSSP